MQKPGTNRVTQEYETLKGRFARWAAAETRIHGLAVLGSRARSDGNADEWSDLNLLVITESAQLLARHTDWLADVGKVWVTYLEESTVGGVLERRVLFDGGFDVDILMLSAQQVERFAREEGAAGFLECMNVLVDKNGLLVRIASTLLKPVAGEPLSREQFAGLVNDFWFHSVWTMKKLSRGELWVAKWCCDSYMKQLLLKMVETHAQVVRGKGNDVRWNGRLFEQWAAPAVVEQLKDAFAHYELNDIRWALRATMDIFRSLAMETANRLGYPYPTAADQHATRFVLDLFGTKRP